MATIQRVEDICGADHLVRLIVHFGDHTRNILAAIRQERENPREIEGKQASSWSTWNRERKMMGEISEGMLFDLGYADKITPVLAVPEHPAPDGIRAGRKEIANPTVMIHN